MRLGPKVGAYVPSRLSLLLPFARLLRTLYPATPKASGVQQVQGAVVRAWYTNLAAVIPLRRMALPVRYKCVISGVTPYNHSWAAWAGAEAVVLRSRASDLLPKHPKPVSLTDR